MKQDLSHIIRQPENLGLKKHAVTPLILFAPLKTAAKNYWHAVYFIKGIITAIQFIMACHYSIRIVNRYKTAISGYNGMTDNVR